LDGVYPPLNDHEKALKKMGQWVRAVQAYRERTGLELYISKIMVDKG